MGASSFFAVVQLLNRVQFFTTPWTAGHHASLSFTIFWPQRRILTTIWPQWAMGPLFFPKALVFKSSGRNDWLFFCLFFVLYCFVFSICTHLFCHRDYFDKNNVPWSNLEEMFFNISFFLEINCMHYHIKYWKKPSVTPISLTVFKRHFLNLIIHWILISRKGY